MVQFTGCKRKGKARAGFFSPRTVWKQSLAVSSVKAGLWEIDMMDVTEKESANSRMWGVIPEV